MTSIPPVNAAIGNPQILNIPEPIKTIQRAAPKLAPAVTPTKPGSAKGLRKIPCKVAPEIANKDPTIADKMTRGKRTKIKTSYPSPFDHKI